jgi:hypothetical protein
MGQDPQAPVASWMGPSQEFFWGVLEKLISLEVQLVKFLLAIADMQYDTREEA